MIDPEDYIKKSGVDGVLGDIVEEVTLLPDEADLAEKIAAPPGQVNGVLDRVAEAEAQVVGLQCNQKVSFLGILCPIVCAEKDRVQIQHGNTLIWLPIDEAVKALGSQDRSEPKRKWDALYRNPLLKPHRP